MQQRIQIPRNGIELAGVLFTPENFDEPKQYPAPLWWFIRAAV